jgi:hypothetical protein
VLNYAEVKALAIGNPLIKKRVEVANELCRIYSLQKKYVEGRWALQKELTELPQKIQEAKSRMDKCHYDAKFFSSVDFVIEKEERQKIANDIFNAVIENEMQDSERVLLNYKGFDIILPKDMPKEKPYIYIQKYGRHYVELGNAIKGVMIRIDNCLEGLQEKAIRLESAYNQLLVNHKNIEDELAKDEKYDELIFDMQEQLKTIDKKLGVKRDE